MLGVIVPAFNEQRSIEQVIRRVLHEPIRLTTSRDLFGAPDPYHQDRQNRLSSALAGGGGDSREPNEEQRAGDFS